MKSLFQNTSLEVFAGLHLEDYDRQYTDTIRQINFILKRNGAMHHAALLLQPLPSTGLMIPADSLIWRHAIFRLACRNDNRDASGATAIFHLLQNHPAVLQAITRPVSRERQQREHQQPVVAPPRWCLFSCAVLAHNHNVVALMKTMSTAATTTMLLEVVAKKNAFYHSF
jgi:hypothetical protein